MQRQTQLANDLWPLLLPRIQAMLAAAANGGGSGGGAVNLAAHDLGGSLHKGTLRNDQAPQFLLTDGTRSLAGSLAVDAGVTIDGVDLSAHAADVNAHHAKLHAVIDAAHHSVAGSQYQIVGLTGVNTLGLLTPSSSPAANAIVKTDAGSMVTFVDLTVTSDLFVTGYLDFGTNTMYEDASYLQVTGSKAVRFGQNIGNAAWTIYNTGGAAFGGTVDITNGGDLTVAGSGSYAGNMVLFADSSGGNVGIMRVPDSQFALDIAGPARADYWIGPHAIQLKNVLLLSHFDGRAPYETNYSGEPNGHMGQIGTATGGTIYRPGKFYKALQCGYATTNLITNPSFELNTAGWATDYAGVTTIVNVPGGVYGSAYVIVSASGTPSNFYGPSVAVTNTTSYVASFWYRSSGTITVAVREYGSATNLSSESLPPASEWTRYTKSVTTPGSNSTNIRIVFTFAAGAVLEIDAVQVETGTAATPYCDGSLGGYSAAGVPDGTGHYWSGSAHASTSIRTGATLRYPAAGNIKADKGTIMAWFYADAWNPNGGFVWQAGNANGEFDGYVNSAGNVVFRINGTSLTHNTGALAVKTWHHAAFTWDISANTRIVYVNGVAAGSTTTGVTPTLDTVISVGNSSQTASTSYFVGYIDDFVILDRVMPASEVRSIYESNAPVFAETSTFTFRPTPKGLIWADDEGLWMRDTAGKPVLGVYGGEAATKNWGGFNLVPGDLLLGNNAVGSSAIWWSRVSGKFGFYGAGSGTPQVEIATDGKLTAGAGKVVLDSTGFHAFNASAVATIDINADGIYLGDGGARTTIGSWTSGNRIRAYNVGEIYEASPETYLDDSSISRTLYPLVIRGIRQGNDAALIEIAAVKSSDGTGAKIIVGEGFRLKDYFGTPYSANRVVHAMADSVILEVPSTTRFTLDSTGIKLAGMTVNTTQSTGVGALKMAGGTNRNNAGFLQASINGTTVYIPYWTTITG